jgi:hypothetical protein
MCGMKCFAQVGIALALVLLVGLSSAYSQNRDDETSRDRVEYRDGEISVTFRQVSVEFAVNAIHARTGFQIIVPPEANRKTLSLYLRGIPIEVAMRSLISSIGFNSFAMTYDRAGRPIRAIILEARPAGDEAATLDQKPASESAPLTAEEKDQLSRALKVWHDLKDDARGRVEDRLRSLPPSEEREELLREYGRQILGIKN